MLHSSDRGKSKRCRNENALEIEGGEKEALGAYSESG